MHPEFAGVQRRLDELNARTQAAGSTVLVWRQIPH